MGDRCYIHIMDFDVIILWMALVTLRWWMKKLLLLLLLLINMENGLQPKCLLIWKVVYACFLALKISGTTGPSTMFSVRLARMPLMSRCAPRWFRNVLEFKVETCNARVVEFGVLWSSLKKLNRKRIKTIFSKHFGGAFLIKFGVFFFHC